MFRRARRITVTPTGLIPNVRPSRSHLLRNQIFSCTSARVCHLNTGTLRLPVGTTGIPIGGNGRSNTVGDNTDDSNIGCRPDHLLPHRRTQATHCDRSTLDNDARRTGVRRRRGFGRTNSLCHSFDPGRHRSLVSDFNNSLTAASSRDGRVVLSFLCGTSPRCNANIAGITGNSLTQIGTLTTGLTS